MNDYTNLRTVPALLSVLFVVMGAYQFGAVQSITWVWFTEYTLTAQHAAVGGLGVFAVAFMSSQTKRFEHYEPFERGLIGATPVIIIGYQWIPQFHDYLVAPYEPHAQVLLFIITLVGWTVAIR